MISLAAHFFVSSFKFLGPVRQVLNTVLPYATMASRSKINFNTKHLKKGDPLPPFNGKLRVFNMRYCPYAQRTILALNAKNIDYEVINVNLVEKPDWLFEKSPLGKVPAIEIKEGETVFESLVTVEYLDDIYPEIPLLPKDPLLKAYDKIVIEATGGIVSLLFKSLRNPESVNEESVENFNKSLKFVEEELIRRGTKFLDGTRPGYGDYMIWPWFERLEQLKDTYPLLKIDEQKYKRLNEYVRDMWVDPAVSQYLIPKDIMLKYILGYATGNVNYELLNQGSSNL